MSLETEILLNILNQEFLGNTVQNFLIALALFFIFKFILKQLIIRLIAKLELIVTKTKTKLDDHLVDVLANIHPRFYDFLSIYFALKTLKLTPIADKLIDNLLAAIIIIQIVSSLNTFSNYLLRRLLHSSDSSEEDKTVFEGFSLLIRIVLWVSGLLFLLANLGINISSLATSLGIGGIAIALAVQNILGDLFSSFSIYFDKPFAVGDTIIVDKYTGTVKRIGLKSTRIQTLQGEELVIGNKELISSKIQNFKRMEKRRVVFTISLSLDSSAEQVKLAKKIISEAILESENAELERVNFFDFSHNALNIEVVYSHKNADYAEYMNEREIINLKIKSSFEKEGINLGNNIIKA